MSVPTFRDQDWLGQGFDGSLPTTPAPMSSETQDLMPDGVERGPTGSTLLATTPRTAARPPEIPGYEILGELGRGGMGVVYKARQTSLNRLVALKVILAGAHASPDDFRRFQTEAEAVAKLSHPHIVQIYEVGVCQGMPYCALEYLPGGNLDRLLSGQPQPPQAAAQLLVPLAQAIHAAHQAGIVHRDLKPANVLLQIDDCRVPIENKQGEQQSVQSAIINWQSTIPKITDFGLAKRLEAPGGQTKTGEILGTPSYMAPEQAASRHQEIGPAADVYSLGAILYEMLTGRPPFQGLSAMETVLHVLAQEVVPPSRLQPNVPRDLETICLKCLQKEASRRYPTAALLAEDLERFLQGVPIQARPVGSVERAWRWCRRNPAVAGLTAALFLALTGGLLGVALLYFQANALREQAELNEQQAVRDRDLARQERERADSHLTLAKKALENTVTKVAEHPKLRQSDFTALRQDLLQMVQPFYEQLAGRESDDPALESERGEAAYRLALLRREIDDMDGALRSVDNAVAILTRLAAKVPETPTYRFKLAHAHVLRGGILQRLGRPAEVEAAYVQARQMQEKLVAEQPQEAENQAALARTINNLAEVWHKSNRLPEAVAGMEQIQKIYAQLLNQQPEHTLYRKEMATAQRNLGTLLEAQGRSEDALQAFQASIQQQEELLRAFPHEPEYRVGLARARLSLGNLLRPRRQPQAEQAYREALALWEQLATDFPTIPGHRAELCATLNNLAQLLAALGRAQEAAPLLNQAYRIREKLVADFPQVINYAVDLGGTACNLGHREMMAGRAEAALPYYDTSIRALESVLSRNAQQPSAAAFLRNALMGRAAALDKLERWPEAVQAWDRALKQMPPTLQAQYRLNRAMSVAQTGDHAHAFAEVAALTTGRPHPGEVYLHLACVCGVAARSVTGQPDLEERYVRRALELLRQARDRGAFKSPKALEILKTLPDLNPLRDRADFQQFLRETTQQGK